MSNQNNKLNSMNQMAKITDVWLVQYARTLAPTTAKLPFINDEVGMKYGVEKGTFRSNATTVQIKGNVLGQIKARIDQLGKDIAAVTTPNTDMKGVSYCQTKDMQKVADLFDDAAIEIQRLKNVARKEWDKIAELSKGKLGELKDHVVFPEADGFLNRYSISLDWLGQMEHVSNAIIKSIGTELGAGIVANSINKQREMMKKGHIALVETLVKQLTERHKDLIDAKRWRPEKFAGILQEVKSISDRNFGNFPEIDDMVDALLETLKVEGDVSALTKEERSQYVKNLDDGVKKAKATVDALAIF